MASHPLSPLPKHLRWGHYPRLTPRQKRGAGAEGIVELRRPAHGGVIFLDEKTISRADIGGLVFVGCSSDGVWRLGVD